jgi:hypothetical protein
MDFKETECDDVEWIELAQDRFKDWALIAVINLHVTGYLT